MKKSIENTMYFGAKPTIFEKAKWLRENMTQAEKELWKKLQKNKVMGYRFKPQHPIDIFIVDFYCHKLKLVIEVDGEIHNKQKEYDIGRTHELERYNLKIIRFTNNEIENNINNVVCNIIEVSKKRKQEILFKSPL